MNKRVLAGLACLALLTGAAWWGSHVEGGGKGDGWEEVLPGVYRSPGRPAGYALVAGDAALLIDAPRDRSGLRPRGVKTVDAVLLTHHHRDACAAVETFLKEGIKVRAPKASAEWLTPANVAKYWKESLPLRSSRTAYLVLPEGPDGIDCSLEDGQAIDWHGWSVRVVASPGHSRDHVCYAARKGKDGPLLLFAGDAFASAGTVPTPYTTDWDHWTDAGLKPAGESLRKLAALKPAVLLPARGPVVTEGAVAALEQTAENVEEMAFLKSYERYTKKRLGDAPRYKFLAREQAESDGSKPWTQVSDHLFITGNTYVLISKESDAFLVVDPWAERSARQIAKLKADRKLGRLEVVMFSHAHYDHYDGIYSLPDRDKFEVWTLDQVAGVIADPALLRAPFLDPRPVKIDRKPKDGESLSWREYRFRFHHLPGQSQFTMGWETVIDGKRCFFTADNWFHQDQFSGTGGWMGLNRSWPLPYAASARVVLGAKPEWVLAEHGGPFEFNEEDWKRRVRWGEVGARAADAMSPSGNHRHDWDPSRVHVEPLLHKAKAGDTLKAVLVASNVLGRAQKLRVMLQGRGRTADQEWSLEVPAGGTARRDVAIRLGDRLSPGRHVLALRVAEGDNLDPSDVFVAVDVEP
ncbi:MAG TPA: MBL fold metallo-hydrolase [Gemmataceae bacterium]|nr:MBL fold metallo-hydrolase [Gemmataceae bacterium]